MNNNLRDCHSYLSYVDKVVLCKVPTR